MSTFKRRLLLIGLGLLAGLAAWPVMELILTFQAVFPSYLIFSIVIGSVFGLILGSFFGTGEGIITSVPSRILKGAGTGAVVGIVGGAVGFLVGQGVLFLVGSWLFTSYRELTTLGLPLARAVGWAILGMFIGIVEGVRAVSPKKILVGFLGGLIGGLIGGFILEYIRVMFPGIMFARLIALVIFGMLIGLFYGIVERRLSFGVLRVLNGRLRGKEYLVTSTTLKIGSSSRSDISLPEYRDVEEQHAVLKVKGEDVYVQAADSSAPVYVNDRLVSRQPLKWEDVIQIGSAKLYYKYE